MDASEVLRKEAQGLALRAQKRAAQLKADLEEIEIKARAIEAERQEKGKAPKRLLNYQPRIGAEYYCPACWIYRGEKAALAQVSSRSRDHNIMRCDCGADWIIPLR